MAEAENESMEAWCDACDEQITGTRFKCTICEDFDLCFACKAQGIHAEHEFIKMSNGEEEVCLVRD
jgi:hypothetical protein